MRFHYDAEQVNKEDRVWASLWNYNTETGELGDSISEVRDYNIIRNRLKDILETHIVIGNVEDPRYEYFRTKGGTEIRVRNAQMGIAGMTVEGSYQANEGEPLVINDIYDQTDGGNGKSYILEGQPIMTTRQTVRDVLAQHEEFSKFLELLDGSGLFETLHNNRNATAGDNITVFNTYHYSVYVPTNESIEQLQRDGILPTWEQVEAYEEAGNLTMKSEDSLKIMNFLK
jgi:hypothetical protein